MKRRRMSASNNHLLFLLGSISLISFTILKLRKRTRTNEQRIQKVTDDIIHEYNTSNKKEAFWIGICGVPGAGKSTLSLDLRDSLIKTGFSCIVVPMDGYHYYRKQLDEFPDPKVAHELRGAPFTFDSKRFAQELEQNKQLLAHGEVQQVYVSLVSARIRSCKKFSLN
jgi:pantothenate kinase